MPEDSPDPKAVPIPGPTPSGYQRTTGGKLRWQPPPVDKLQSLLAGYEVISLIGHGGMGAVYRARQLSLDRQVAVKILPPEAAEDDATFVERFKNEARTMAKLNHPGIVHVHDFGETSDGQLYIVMEFVEGTDVQRMLLDHRVLTPAYALPITAHVCDALQYAHTHGVVHRDVKPANIMLTNEGQVKVADFGLARLDDPAAGGLTQANMSMGTPDYVAPEALTVGMTPDGRADLYAVGVMLYHMVVGEVPRGAFDLPSRRNGTLDPRIDAIILRAMKQNRDERYQSAAELRADVDAILAMPRVQSGGEPSAAIPKQVVVRAQASPPAQAPSQKPVSRSAPVKPTNRSAPVKPTNRSAPVTPAKKQTVAVTPVLPEDAPEESSDEAKPRNLAWMVPTGISAAVILGGAFFMRGQRQKEIVPEASAAPVVAHAKSQDGGHISPAGPIKVIDDRPVKAGGHGTAGPASVWNDVDVAGCWTRGTQNNHMLLLAGGDVRLLRDGKEDLRPNGTPWWTGWRWKLADGLVHLHADDGKEAETLKLTAPDEAALTALSKGEARTSKRVPLAAPGFWCPVRFPGGKPPKGELRDGALRLPKRESVKLPGAYAARDAVLRLRVTNTSEDGSFKGIYLKLRNDNAVGFFNLGQADIANVGAQPDFKNDLVILGTSARGVVPLHKKDLLVEFAAVGDDLIFALDGKVVASAKTNGPGKVPSATGGRANPPFLASIMSGWNEATFRDIELMPLDGVSADRLPDFVKAARSATSPSAQPAASIAASSAPASPAPAPVPAKPKLPAELLDLQKGYAAAIAERVTSPHDASVKQLNSGFAGALDRAVAARQLGADAIAADKKAVGDKAALPPDLDTTPDALKTLRATYRAKIAEIDDTRTTAHLGLLTPYIAKLKQIEADLTKAARIPDAEIVKAYRESLSENPFALPEAAP